MPCKPSLLSGPVPRRATGALALLVSIASAPSALAQLPDPPVPAENPITPAKTVLGKILFWDEQLSSDNSMACATCHLPEFGGSDPNTRRIAGPDGVPGNDDDIFGSPGVVRTLADGTYEPSAEFGLEKQVTGRFAPPMIMAQYFTVLFWEGRAQSEFIDPQTGEVRIKFGGALESQASGPPVSDVEMSHIGTTWDDIVAKLAVAQPLKLATDLTPDIEDALQHHPTYPDLFEKAFGDPAVTAARAAFAIATYQRTLIPDETPWDLGTLSPSQMAGEQVFVGKGACISCHLAPLFTDDQFHNIGVRPSDEDLGRYLITGNDHDRGSFKTSTVRNASLRPRFMHNGGMETLMEVIEFYDRGGDFFDNLDSGIFPLDLTEQERLDLHDFISGGLTDPRVAAGLPPFDHPTLHSQRMDRNPLPYGGFSTGTGGFVPEFIADAPPNLGNGHFKLGLKGALGGSLAWLAVHPNRTPPGTVIHGIPVNVQLDALTAFLPFAVAGAGPGEGYATSGISIPQDPALIGIQLFFQWFVEDPAAAGGFAASQGVRVSVF